MIGQRGERHFERRAGAGGAGDHQHCGMRPFTAWPGDEAIKSDTIMVAGDRLKSVVHAFVPSL
ncbi:hypothetical protein [Novosphingobium resinovorum]|uniref:hypothetical protein n=1 Tax=Novosphingobium resinovorum TaxID=158500 RepID=UPI003D272B03